MLKIFRNETVKKRIFWVLAIVVSLSFVITGLILREPGEKDYSTAIGTFDGKKIPVRDYLAHFNATRHQLQILFGDNFSEIAGALNLKAQALDRLLLVEQAKKEGIKVTDGEVVDWLGTQSFFNNQGRFETELYQRYIRQILRTEPRQFEEEVRQMLMIQKLREKKLKGVEATDAEAEAFYRESLKKEDGTETPFDAALFEKEKESFRKEALEKKSDSVIRKEAEDLRKRFVPNPKMTDLL